MPALLLVLHAALVAVAAPVLDGWMRQAAARWRGEAGPPWDQSWRDLVRLWRKPAMAPAGASFVFAGAPAVALGAAVVAALLVPGFSLGMATAGAADLVVVAGLLGLSRAVVALAAYDVGSTPVVFAGARVMAARVPAEPVLLLVALAALLLSGGTNVDAVAAAVRDGGPGLRAAAVLVGVALMGLAAHEGGVPPGFGGRQQAMLMAAGQVRRVVLLALVLAVGAPFGMAGVGAGVAAWVVGVACWVLKMGVLGAVLAGLGPHRALLAAAALLALIAAVLLAVQGSA